LFALSIGNINDPARCWLSAKPDGQHKHGVFLLMNIQLDSLARVSLQQVSLKRAGKAILQTLSVTFPAGKVSGLIGHNGSGKSTLLDLLGRHLSPSGGQIMLNDQPLNTWPNRQFARQVAYLPQYPPAAEGLTVRELVSMGRYPWHGALGRFSREDRQKVEQAIDWVGLTPFAGRLVDSLSGGERQRAWLATALAQESRCLLLDEPTSALDLAHQVDVLARVRQLSVQLGLTVITVLHDINMAARFCDYLVALRAGQIVAEGEPLQIMQAATLQDIYGIAMGTMPHPCGGVPLSFIYC
jgi:iron-chelate-transporting ATPase